MTRDEVAVGLECLITNKVVCEGCPYYGSESCLQSIAKDAQTLLKEQEAMIPARAVAEWLAEYAAPPEMKIVPGTHEGRTFAWLAVLQQLKENRKNFNCGEAKHE